MAAIALLKSLDAALVNVQQQQSVDVRLLAEAPSRVRVIVRRMSVGASTVHRALQHLMQVACVSWTHAACWHVTCV